MPLLHIGDHTVLRLNELAAHLFEPDHVFFAALTVIVGVMAYKHGRRTEARVQAQRKDTKP